MVLGAMAGMTYLGLFQGGVDARFEVAEVAKDTFLELFHVSDRSPKGFEAKDQGADNVRPGDVVDARPEDAGDVL